MRIIEVNFKKNTQFIDKVYDIFSKQIKNANWTKQMLAESEHVLVATKSEKVVGFLNYFFNGEGYEILQIATAENFQKQGVATSLLQFLFNLSKDKQIYLEVEDGNVPAISLYEKNGFIAVGKRRKYYSSGCDAILYSKILTIN